MRKLLALPILVLALCACSGSTPPSPAPAQASGAAAQTSYPKTVAVGDTQVTIKAQPKRIVALSSETADIVLALVGPQNMVAVPNGSVTPGVGNMVDAAKKVANVLPSGITPDSEQILSYTPDLVLLTARHSGEQHAGDVLKSADVPTLAFKDKDLESPDAVKATITTLGEALNASAKASELNAAITQSVDKVTKTKFDDKPRVLSVFSRGGKLFISSAGSLQCNLIKMAHGECISAERGFNTPTPVDAEQLLSLNPDVIIVEDFYNSGLGPFKGLLSNPAVATVPAIAKQRVQAIPMTLISSTATFKLGDGLLEVAKLLHPGKM